MDILIAGDLVPINSNESIFLKGDLSSYFCDFKETFENADLFIANLECPLTDQNTKINKSGSCLKADPKTVNGIAQLNINLLSAANNHIGDFGKGGVEDTIELLTKHKLNKVGLGSNPETAKMPFILEKDENSVGVLSYADYEFGIVDDETPGANPFSFINAYNDITALKDKVDYIIVLLHDGKEYYPYPSPDLQKICRHLADLGADLVICQHSHIIGAIEDYNSTTMVYGQGNFIFDYRDNRTSSWSNGFFIKINLESKSKKLEFLPYKQTYPGVSKLSHSDEELFFETLKSRAIRIKDKEFVKLTWDNFVMSQKENYLSSVFGHNLFLGKILKKTGFYKYAVSSDVALIVLNFLRSRVHRESFISILENVYQKSKTK